MLLLYVLALAGLCGRACGAQAGGDSGRAASATGDRPGRAAEQPLPHRPAQWAAVSELQWDSVSVIYCINSMVNSFIQAYDMAARTTSFGRSVCE